MKTGRLSFFLACLLGVPGPSAFAASGRLDADAGTRGALLLDERFSVRSQGMGRASAALADGGDLLFGNPAALPAARYVELSAAQRRMTEEVVHSFTGLAVPLGDVTSANVRGFGVVSAGYGVLDYGDFAARDAAGNPAPNFKAQDALWTFGYGKSFRDRLLVGGRMNLYRMKISDRKARGTAYDAGVLYRAVPGRWNVGLAVFNSGGDLSFGNEREELPVSYAGGVAFCPSSGKARLAFDVVRPRDGLAAYRAGGEWMATDLLALRAGYDTGNDLGNGWTFGAGLRIHKFEALFYPVRDLNLDYSFVPAKGTVRSGSSTDAGTHNFSLTLRLGD